MARASFLFEQPAAFLAQWLRRPEVSR